MDIPSHINLQWTSIYYAWLFVKEMQAAGSYFILSTQHEVFHEVTIS